MMWWNLNIVTTIWLQKMHQKLCHGTTAAACDNADVECPLLQYCSHHESIGTVVVLQQCSLYAGHCRKNPGNAGIYGILMNWWKRIFGKLSEDAFHSWCLVQINRYCNNGFPLQRSSLVDCCQPYSIWACLMMMAKSQGCWWYAIIWHQT